AAHLLGDGLQVEVAHEAEDHGGALARAERPEHLEEELVDLGGGGDRGSWTVDDHPEGLAAQAPDTVDVEAHERRARVAAGVGVLEAVPARSDASEGLLGEVP